MVIRSSFTRFIPPLVTVIVPAYNCEDHVETAIRSVLNQGVRRVEVIVVDDMSTDGTREVVRAVAARDPRVKLLSSGVNGGPGRARNIGVQAAQGKYIAFVDADDRVLPRAYKRMLGTIKKSGSDFISGGYRRVGAAGGHRPEVTKRVHAEKRVGVTLEEFPGVLEEPVLWNKIYRRKFWLEKVGPIPEDRNYEDQEPAIRAALEAKTFDVADYDVYSWTLPDGRETRSQSKRTIEDLRSRVLVVESLLDMSKRMPENARTLLEATILGRDLGMYLSQVPYTGDDYWEMLNQLVSRVSGAVAPESIDLIAVSDRLLAYVGAHGSQQDVATLVSALDEHGRAIRWVHQDGRWVAALPHLDELQIAIPDDVLSCGTADLSLRAKTWSLKWETDSQLHLTGYAYVPGVSPAEWLDRKISLETSGGETIWEGNLPHVESEWVNVETTDPWVDYSAGAFEADIPVPTGIDTDLRVVVTVELPGIADPLRSVLSYPMGIASPACSSDEDATLRATKMPEGQLRITKGEPCGPRQPSATLDAIEVDGDRATLSGVFPLGIAPGRVEMALIGSGKQVSLQVSVSSDNAWSASVDLADPDIPSVGMFLMWKLAGHAADGNSWTDVAPRVGLVPGPPLRLVGGSRAIAVTALYGKRTGITLSPPLTNLERSRFGRQQLSDSQPPPLQDAILFDSFTGKNAGDNPLAVYEQLRGGSLDERILKALPQGCAAWPAYWAVIDGTYCVPDGVTPVVIGSPDWFDISRSARLLVTNNNLPTFFKKEEGQFWLQTWHGTPMKKLLLDAPRETTSALYRRTMARQVPDWDLLLAQDDRAATDLRSSTGYAGEVLVVEQPRNARLFVAGLRDAVRERLGIPDDAFVVLYAPTWRKGDVAGGGGSHVLNPKRLAEQTAAFVLVRAHHMASIPIESAPRVKDVSGEPRVEDLMVASDLLISDYSSIFFDYALLGRPTIAYVPDLEEYSTKERGFYRRWPGGDEQIVAYTADEVTQIAKEQLGIGERHADKDPQPED